MTPEQRSKWVREMGARQDWWALTPEEVVEPGWDIIDPHCHFWLEKEVPDPSSPERMLKTSEFMPADFMRQLSPGHRVRAIVYVECGSGYFEHGEAHMRPVGETVFACQLAKQFKAHEGAPDIAAIVAFADLGGPHLDTVLDAHVAAGEGRVRAIRHSAARLDDPSARLLAGVAPQGLYQDEGFRRGVARLGERGFAFEAFQFHFQLKELADLAAAVPDTYIVVNHLGAPVGFRRGPQEDQRVMAEWREGIKQLADCRNVVMKLGGMASPVTEYDAPLRDRPPTSDEFIAERGAYFHAAIDTFGADRCMFESNFPVDSVSLSYTVLWNAYKKMAAEYPQAKRVALLSGTAQQYY